MSLGKCSASLCLKFINHSGHSNPLQPTDDKACSRPVQNGVPLSQEGWKSSSGYTPSRDNQIKISMVYAEKNGWLPARTELALSLLQSSTFLVQTRKVLLQLLKYSFLPHLTGCKALERRQSLSHSHFPRIRNCSLSGTTCCVSSPAASGAPARCGVHTVTNPFTV